MSDNVEALIRAFTNDLNSLVRQAALNAVTEALGGSPQPVKRGPGRPRKVASAPAAPSAKRKARAGGKRPAAELAKTVDALLAHIRSHPGERIEQIGKHLKIKTKDLALPTRKLLVDRKITKRGQKRSTQYFPAKG